MTKKWFVLLLSCLALGPVSPVFAQITPTTQTTSFAQTDTSRQQIAIFTPLYLDTAFDMAGNYRFDAKTFPKQASQGLEFWEGAELAIDSLKKEGIKMDIHVYDTKMPTQRIDSLLASEAFKSTDLIIGQVTATEAVKFANIAAAMDVPFINVNMPSDAGIQNNPHYVILSSTLLTHCVGIYRFLQKNYSLQEIIVFRKKGVQEDRVRNYFTEFEKTTAVKLKLKYVTLENNFTQDQLELYLNDEKPNICLAGSLDPLFAQTLCQQLALLSKANSPNVVVGMPTWDQIDFEKSQYKNLEIIYSTPFYIAPTGKLAASVLENFKSTYYSRPSDMVFRGYETLYHFAHLLKLYGKNVGSSLSDKKYMLFSEFDIQPVINRTTMTHDYYENKKLYFVKKVDGVVKTVY
ncbi:amino acid ABC transporter substrate-binding protein [Niastella caeni]|uniref:Amino acid ABC transporter substrate-binding protein n=1 Tax=Niastella caeni TaxID=2569763 RepID=A0A4S8HBF1_9BACT|nr:amino acid ABC transporter substrate-binding protein [Niastella caeni]THU32015.1 amino acid ABC transporter substrate-binding protein [Niastella caeni]